MAAWYWITGWIFSVVSLIGNGFSIYLIINRRRLFTLPNWIIRSPALADFLLVLSYFPASFFCNLFFHCNRGHRIMMASVFMYASVSDLVVLTIDRYISITLPLRYVVMVTTRRVLVAVTSAWLLSLSLAPIQYLAERTESKDVQRTFAITRIAVMEVVPIALLITVTVRMLLIRRKHRRQAAIQVSQLRYNKWRGKPACHFKLSRTRREMSTVQIICAVVAVFVVCYATNILLSLCIGLNVCDPPIEIRDLLGILLIVNSSVNPFAYAFLKRDFKKECEGIFCPK